MRGTKTETDDASRILKRLETALRIGRNRKMIDGVLCHFGSSFS